MSGFKVSSSENILKQNKEKDIEKFLQEFKSKVKEEGIINASQPNYIDSAKILANANLKKDMAYIAKNANTTIYQNLYKRKDKDKVAPDKSSKNTKMLKGLAEDGFFDVISNNTQTGSKLIQKTINYNEKVNVTPTSKRSVGDVNSIKSAIDKLSNIYDNGGYILSYDLETIGGPNKYGHSQQDLITEMSATTFKYTPGMNHLNSDDVVDTTFDTLIGINKSEYKELYTMLDNIEKAGTASGHEDVVLGRLGVYGDSGTKLGKFDGFRVGLESGANSSNLKSTNIKDRVKKAKQGVDFLSKVGEKQSEWVAKNTNGISFEDYRTKEIQAFKDFVFKGIGAKKGGSLNESDNWISAGHNTHTFDAKVLKTLTGDSSEYQSEHFDLLKALRYIEENNPNAQILKGKDGKNIILDGEFSQNQLENIVRSYGLLREDRPSHIALEDQHALFRAILTNQKGSDPNQKPLFDHVQKEFNSLYENNKNKYTQGTKDKVFLSNGLMANWNQDNENLALGFSYDPVTKKYKTYNGYEIDKNGEVVQSGYREYGPKTNMLLQHDVRKVDINSDEMQKIFKGVNDNKTFSDKMFQDLQKASSLYVIESTEYLDESMRKEILGGMDIYEEPKKFFTVVTSENEISSMLGLEVLNKNGNITKGARESDFVLDFMSENGEHDRVKVSSDQIEYQLRKRSVNARLNDTAERTIREGNSKKLFEIQKSADKVKADNPNSKLSLEVAELISKNKTVGGYNDSLIKTLQEQKLLGNNTKKGYNVTSDSIKKSVSLINAFENNEEFFRAMNNILDSNIGSAAGDNLSEDFWNKRSFALNHIMESLAEEFKDNEDVIKAYYKKSGGRISTKKDTNTIDFNLQDINPAKYKRVMQSPIGMASKDSISLDVSNPYSFFKPFQEAIYGSRDIKFEGTQGLNIVQKTYDSIQSMPEHKNLLKGFNPKRIEEFQREKGSYSQLAGELLGTVRKNLEKQRKDNPNYGYKFARNNMDMQSPNFFSALSSTVGVDKVKEVANKSMSTMPNLSLISSFEDSGLLAGDLVNKFFFNISEDEFKKQTKGLSTRQKKVLRANFDLAKEDATEYAKSLLESVHATNASIGLFEVGGEYKLGAFQNNEFMELSTYKYGLQDGAVYAQIGNDRYSSHLALDNTEMYSRGKLKQGKKAQIGNMAISTNFRVSRQGESMQNLTKSFLNQGNTDLESLVLANKRILSRAAYKKVRVEKNNFIAFDKAMQINTEGIIPLIADASEDIISTAKSFYDGDSFFSDNDVKQFRDMASRIKRLKSSNEKLPTSLEDLLASEKNLLNIKFLDPIKMWIKDGITQEVNGIDIAEDILSSISTTFVKDTNVMAGSSGLQNEFIDPTASYDDIKRPPVTQKGKVQLNSIEDIKKSLDYHARSTAKSIFIDAIENGGRSSSTLTSNLAERFMNNLDGKYTGSTKLTQTQINSETFRNIINIDKYEKYGDEKKYSAFSLYEELNKHDLSSTELNNRTDKLYRKAMMVSTYEQQGLMDSRFSDTFFNNTNIRTIKDKKVMISNMVDDLSTTKLLKLIDETKFKLSDTGAFEYQKGSFFKKGEKIFELAKDLEENKGKEYRAEYDSIIEGVYLDSREMAVSEKEIQNVLSSEFTGNVKNDIEVKEFLDSKYDWGYKIIGNEELGGIKISSTASEKATINTGKFAVGTFDESINDRISNLLDSIDNVEEQKIVKSIVGIVPEKKFLDKAGSIISKYDEGLYDDILTERYAFGDFLQTFEQFNNSQLFLSVDAVKHSSISQGLYGAFEDLKSMDLLTDDTVKAITGTGELKDGRVFLNNPDRLHISKDKLMQNGLDEETASSIENVFKSKNTLNIEGEYTDGSDSAFSSERVNVTQTIDHIDSTVRGNDVELNRKKFEKAILQEDLNNLEHRIYKLQNMKEKNPLLEMEEHVKIIEELNSKRIKAKEQIAELTNSIDSFKGDKGLKFSERMLGTLNMLAHTEDRNKIMKDAFIQGEMNAGSSAKQAADKFAEYLKGTVSRETGELTEDFLGKKVLSPITQNLQGLLFKGEGEQSIAEDIDDIKFIKSEISNGEKITNVEKKILNDWELKNSKIANSIPEEYRSTTSLSKAENLLSFIGGEKAMHFNEAKHGSIKALQDNGFKMVDLSEATKAKDWMPINISGDAKLAFSEENNPYTNNLIIKTGLEEDGYKYIASGSMPLKMFGEDVGKSESIKSLERVQRSVIELHENKDPNEVSNLQRKVKWNIDSFKKNQRKDLASKTGLYGELTETRMSQSAFLRGRGLTVQKTSYTGRDLMEGTASDFKERLEEFDKVNPILAKMSYNGESLNEHFMKGRVIDSVQLSESTFSDMGYFDEKFMDSVFESDGSDYKGILTDYDSKKKTMINILETKGDSFLATRYPEIMEGSDKMVMGYLNKELRSNEAIAVGATGVSMKLDHDGDKFGVKRISVDGLSKIHEYAGIDDKNLNEHMQAFDNAIMSRALVENRYWDDRVEEQLKKEFNVAKSGYSVADLASKKSINGTIYPAATFDKNKDYQYYQNNYNKYSKYIEEGEKEYLELDKGARENFTNANDVILEKINMSGDTSLDEQGLALARGYEEYRAQNISKIFKSAVGEVNVTSFKIKTAFTSMIDEKTPDYNYNVGLIHDMFYWSEEAAISAKKNIKGLDPARAKIFNDSVMQLIKREPPKNQTLSDVEQTLKDWTNEYIIGETNLGYHYQNSDTFRKMAESHTGSTNYTDFKAAVASQHKGVDKIKSKMVDDYIDIIKRMADNDGFSDVLESLASETSSAGISSEQFRKTRLLDIQNSTNDMKVRKMIATINNDEKLFRDAVTDKADIAYKSLDDAFGGIYKSVAENSSQKMTANGIMEAGADFFKSVGGSGIAKGALGLAAAVMTAGYIGGRPRPADVHAMEEAKNEISPAGTGMVLSDVGYQNPSSPQGYVVNINARTDQAKENVANAISSAISSASQSNININMNINEEYGQISDSDLRESIWGVF